MSVTDPGRSVLLGSPCAYRNHTNNGRERIKHNTYHAAECNIFLILQWAWLLIFSHAYLDLFFLTEYGGLLR